MVSKSSVPSITLRIYTTANRGSIPLEHPANMEMDPVGAIVNLVAFLIGASPFLSNVEPLKFVNGPRSSASFCEAFFASISMNLIISSATEIASSLSYEIPS